MFSALSLITFIVNMYLVGTEVFGTKNHVVLCIDSSPAKQLGHRRAPLNYSLWVEEYVT